MFYWNMSPLISLIRMLRGTPDCYPHKSEYARENLSGDDTPWMPIAMALHLREVNLRVEHERCRGLDVHKETVIAGVVVPDASGKPEKEIRAFRTLTEELRSLAAWL